MASLASIVPDTVEANMSTTTKLANTAAEAGFGVCGQDTERVSRAALPNGAIFGSLCQIGLSAKPFSAWVVKPAALVISFGYCGASIRKLTSAFAACGYWV